MLSYIFIELMLCFICSHFCSLFPPLTLRSQMMMLTIFQLFYFCRYVFTRALNEDEIDGVYGLGPNYCGTFTTVDATFPHSPQLLSYKNKVVFAYL